MPAATRPRIGRPANPPDPVIAGRIRALRQGAGLTQAQLAGSDFSKSFIGLVETGRTGLSLRAARIFAGRLGVPVDELLRPGRTKSDREAEIALARAEADLAAGRTADALESAKALTRSAPQLRARVLRLRGRALLEADRAAEAVPDLDEALRLFRQKNDREGAARTLYDLARAYARTEAHGEAAHYGLECEHALIAGEIVDASLEMRVLSFLAGVFVTLGDHTSADLRIERARRLAEDIAEPRGVANLYYHLAVLRQREGDAEAALRFAHKARELYEQLGVAAHVGSVWNTIGWIHIKRGHLAQAEEALSTAAHIAESEHDGRLTAYVIQNQAELALARGMSSEAVALATSSIEHPEAPARAKALSLLVRAEALAQTDATTAKVNAAYAEAAKALAPFGPNLAARAHRSHFDALMHRGEIRDANEAAVSVFKELRPILM